MTIFEGLDVEWGPGTEITERKILSIGEWLGWRAQDVTASDAACLWGDGVHPYRTAYSLWAEKSGLLPPARESPAMRRGRLLEPVAMNMIREDRPGWSVFKNEYYYRHSGARIGATPDTLVFDHSRPDPKGTVQIKTVGSFSFKRSWKDQDTGELIVPLHVAVQAAIEAYLSGASWAAVAVMIAGDGGLDLEIVDVPLGSMSGIVRKLRGLVEQFWRRVESGEAYPPDWSKDAATILSVFRDASQPGIVIAPDDKEFGALVAERDRLSPLIAAGEAARNARKIVDAQIIQRLGNSASARFGEVTVTASTVKRKAYEVEESTYRAVKVRRPLDYA